jgi:DNA-binding NarL/FixJ family response regulator
MIRVLIVDDEPLIAEAHREYAQRIPGLVVHGTVGTGTGALRPLTAPRSTSCCSISGCRTPAASTWRPP